MTMRLPTPSQLEDVATEIGLSLSQVDVESFLGLLKPLIDSYQVVDQLPDELPIVKYPRTPGYRPTGAENKNNAWYYKTTIKGAPVGKLQGKTVALKDNVMLAGVPMMNGASTMEGFVPEIDATIVTRLLDAGATILGKAHCEYFCLSGGSHTSAAGPVQNPGRPAIPLAARPRGLRRWSLLARSTWPSAAIKGDRSASRRPIAACTE
jgi:amidase